MIAPSLFAVTPAVTPTVTPAVTPAVSSTYTRYKLQILNKDYKTECATICFRSATYQAGEGGSSGRGRRTLPLNISNVCSRLS